MTAETTFSDRGSASKGRLLLLAAVIICACIVALGVGLGFGVLKEDAIRHRQCPQTTAAPTTAAPTTPKPGPTPFPSIEGRYRFAAVAADAEVCSRIGTELMAREGGTAVDGAITTLLCDGIGNPQSTGIGGGFFMTIYIRERNEVKVIMAREQAPSAAFANMYKNMSSQLGGYSVAVPGEIRGMRAAWEIGGRTPWNKLFQPAIRLAEEGVIVKQPIVDAMESSKAHIANYKALRNFLTNPETGDLYKVGEVMKRPLLAKTLRIIAEEGPDAFYNGSLSRNISLDIKDAGGIITEDDLKSYTAPVVEPVTISLFNNAKVYSPPPPSSGAIYQYILNILSGYEFNHQSLSGVQNATLTLHRIVEAFKFGFAKRSSLGDPDVENDEFKANINELLANLTSMEFADKTRSEITDQTTHGTAYYRPTFYDEVDSGTSHVSVLGANGDAVAATSTINLYFGSKVYGPRTGIIFNDEMDDFSTPGTVNAFDVPASPANFIKPGKRPLSSMVPTIVVGDDGEVDLCIGASGGTRILTATALVTMETLWFKMGIKQAIDYPRIHHQLVPTDLYIEQGFPEEFIEGLRQKGHNVTMWPDPRSRVQGVLRSKEGEREIYANSDHRKFSNPDGY